MRELKYLRGKSALLTVMVQADNPDRVEQLIDLAAPMGAEAFGMQFCRMKPEYRSEDTYRRLFAKAGGLPVYVTNYRQGYNEGKSDDELACGLLTLAECGADLVDLTADLFDKSEGEFSTDPAAVEKQMRLIDAIHERGAEVVMSSHVLKFLPAERVFEIAREAERRGADMCKIVLWSSSVSEQLEILRIADMLKNEISIPYLILSGGESTLVRRVGCAAGSCTYLCVYEHDELSTKSQPTLAEAKAVRDLILRA